MSLLAYLKEELRLIRAKTWGDGAYEGPKPLTYEDPRVQHTLKRLELARRSMARRQIKTLLTGAEYRRGSDLRERIQ